MSVIAESAGLGNITKSSLEHNLSRFRKEVNSFREKTRFPTKRNALPTHRHSIPKWNRPSMISKSIRWVQSELCLISQAEVSRNIVCNFMIFCEKNIRKVRFIGHVQSYNLITIILNCQSEVRIFVVKMRNTLSSP